MNYKTTNQLIRGFFLEVIKYVRNILKETNSIIYGIL